MYFHYLYFNAVKWSYLQGMVIVPYLALAPTIVTGAITLGFVQQIARAFNKVEKLQYLVRSWPIIVELISVQRRLSEFESKLERASLEQENLMDIDKVFQDQLIKITQEAAVSVYPHLGKNIKSLQMKQPQIQ